VSLDTGSIAGFESLLRWPRPGQDTLMPGQFIDIAEDTGLIVPLGAWAIRRALCDLASGRAHAGWTKDPFISVNVSASQFRSGSLVVTVRDALKDAGLPPSLLLLELTESVRLYHGEGIAASLAEFKRLGVRLAIDDFGTGYSSLNYLKRFPIDKLKIDQSFIRDISAGSDDAAIVQAIIAMAHSLRLRVVAEGVEHQSQLEFLRGLGNDEYQGYLFSKPLPARDIERQLLPAGAQADGALTLAKA